MVHDFYNAMTIQNPIVVNVKKIIFISLNSWT